MDSAAALVHNLDMSVEIDFEADKTQHCSLLDQAVEGDEVTLVANAFPSRVLGSAKGSITMGFDFDAQLPEEILDAFER